ncbi:MAG: ATP-binding protein [Candidatus Kapabacteria bacterium]|nr:ATP-binding protein [Candidatus Kapabacteria bacterium]
MSKILDVQIQDDYLRAITLTKPIDALCELIWNSLDADATEIRIEFILNPLSGYDSISIIDNGHGINYQDAETAFSSLGGSSKKYKKCSPKNRILHGKEGKGRYKAFSLGSNFQFISRFIENGLIKEFDINLSEDKLKKPILNDIKTISNTASAGVKVIISNIKPTVSLSFSTNIIFELEKKFAVYYSSYKNFNITVNNTQLNFADSIIDEAEINFQIQNLDNSSLPHEFKVKILEWCVKCDKKIFFCNISGIALGENKLTIRTSNFNLTVYIMSGFIEDLYQEGQLDIAEELNETLSKAIQKTNEFIKDFIRLKLHQNAKDFITELKSEHIYPFNSEPKSEAEKVERQVFDILALNVNEHLPGFEKQDSVNKKLTFRLIKEALENDPKGFSKIIKEVLDLPQDKRDDLVEILDRTSLSTILDVIKEITDRLQILYELEQILFDTEINKKVLERKHLHKIVKNETWIFGDDYTYGADDVSLRNVLKKYLKDLGREDFLENIQSNTNSDLDENIPDICLWKQYNLGKSGHFANLVIELKRPSKTIGQTELSQIKKYARVVSDDSIFPKDRTNWTFILLATKLNDDALFECKQENREFGHIYANNSVNVFVKQWGVLLNEAKSRHQYLKEKLNFEITEENEGISLLKKKYSEYLPIEI